MHPERKSWGSFGLDKGQRLERYCSEQGSGGSAAIRGAVVFSMQAALRQR